MKERIVIDSKNIKCAEDLRYVIAKKEDCKVEQEPENFEELTENCKVYISEKFKVEQDNIRIQVNKGWMFFDVCGDIVCEPSCVIIAERRTPTQMWQIIRNLLGEQQ